MNTSLKLLRLQNGYTQRQLAEFLNVKQNTYSQYETGARELPLEVLVRIARLYNTSTDYILNLTDEEDPYPSKK